LRFKFKLDTILKLREREEEGARIELVRVRNEIHMLEDQLERAKKDINEMRKEMLERMEEGMKGEEIPQWKSYIEHLEVKMREIQEKILEKRKEEKKKLEIYLEKRKEREALEKLRKRKFDEYRRGIDLKERKIIDEVAQRNYWRSNFE
jgi:flagellar FliJ protein